MPIPIHPPVSLVFSTSLLQAKVNITKRTQQKDGFQPTLERQVLARQRHGLAKERQLSSC